MRERARWPDPTLAQIVRRQIGIASRRTAMRLPSTTSRRRTSRRRRSPRDGSPSRRSHDRVHRGRTRHRTRIPMRTSGMFGKRCDRARAARRGRRWRRARARSREQPSSRDRGPHETASIFGVTSSREIRARGRDRSARGSPCILDVRDEPRERVDDEPDRTRERARRHRAPRLLRGHRPRRAPRELRTAHRAPAARARLALATSRASSSTHSASSARSSRASLAARVLSAHAR
jgi:hypothetical protein